MSDYKSCPYAEEPLIRLWTTGSFPGGSAYLCWYKHSHIGLAHADSIGSSLIVDHLDLLQQTHFSPCAIVGNPAACIFSLFAGLVNESSVREGVKNECETGLML